MKITARQIEAFVRSPDPNVYAFLVYGPDSSIVTERAVSLCTRTGIDLDDPFAAAAFRGEDLARDSGRLFDEASSITFGGGPRVIRVRGAVDGLAEEMSHIFERSVEGVIVVLEAGELPPRSRLRRLFEETDQGAAIPCYEDNEAVRERLIEDMLRSGDRTADRRTIDFLASQLSGDRGVARREIEKLLLFCDDQPGPVTLDQVASCVGDESEHVLEDVAMAAASGRLGELTVAYDRCLAAGQAEVSILRALSRHLQRLHTVSIRRDDGATVENAMGGLRPPVFFKVKAAFAGQVSFWTSVRLQHALDIVLKAERSCKTTGMPSGSICERTLFQIASAARAR